MGEETHEVVIIGGGPAGLTASIYTGRANLETVTINGPRPGGQVINTDILENFPGFPEGIEGPDLSQKLMAQAEKFGVDLKFEEVVDVEIENKPFKVKTHLNTFRARTLIIATGARPRKLGLEKEDKLTGNGVSYCATCDGAMHKDEVVAVAGGGDSALEEADYLTQFASKVYLIHRRDEYRAGESAVERIQANDKIEPVLNSNVIELKGDKALKGLKLENTQTGEKFALDEVEGLFIAIGYNPNSDLFCDELDCNDRGYIVTDEFQRTNVAGVYAAGDVQDNHYQQVVTASASGAKAAMEVNSYLRRQNQSQ